jgi:hypothetical protein
MTAVETELILLVSRHRTESSECYRYLTNIWFEVQGTANYDRSAGANGGGFPLTFQRQLSGSVVNGTYLILKEQII